jgi:hypothetical protein
MRREGDAPALVVRDNKTLHDSTRGRTRVELFQAIKRYPRRDEHPGAVDAENTQFESHLDEHDQTTNLGAAVIRQAPLILRHCYPSRFAVHCNQLAIANTQ